MTKYRSAPMSKQQYEQFLAEKIQQGQKDIAQEKTVTLEQSRQAVEQLLIRKEQARHIVG